MSSMLSKLSSDTRRTPLDAFDNAHPLVVGIQRISIEDAPMAVVCGYDMHTVHNLTVGEGVCAHAHSPFVQHCTRVSTKLCTPLTRTPFPLMARYSVSRRTMHPAFCRKLSIYSFLLVCPDSSTGCPHFSQSTLPY